jgi:hypothetical protein
MSQAASHRPANAVLLLWTLSDWLRRKRLLVTFVVVVGVLLLISEVCLHRW